MQRQTKTVESGRSERPSMRLPAVVLAVTLALGVAASLRLAGSDDGPVAEAPVAQAAVAEAPKPVEPAAVEPAAVEPEVVIPVVIVPEVVVPQGREGLVEAMRRGELRPGSRADVEGWVAAARASGQSVDPERLLGGMRDVFVIEKDVVIPAGLTGAHAVIFVLPSGTPFPRGDLGHSLILDLPSGGCIGATCQIMLNP